jgi:hypothetical protein
MAIISIFLAVDIKLNHGEVKAKLLARRQYLFHLRRRLPQDFPHLLIQL